MEPQSSSCDKKYLVLGIFLSLIGGALIATFADPYLPAPVSNSAKGYQAGFTAAKTLVEKSSLGGLLGESSARTLSGTVTAVNGSELTLQIKSTNPFDDPALAFRTVLIDSSTSVVKLVLKDAKAYQAEMASYANVQAKLPTTSPVPSPFTQTPASVADIVVGDSVTVTAADDVKTAVQFTAQSIQIRPRAVQ